MNTSKKTVKYDDIQPPNVLRMRMPETEKGEEWMVGEIENYKEATKYLAFYLMARASFEDMTEDEVWEEIARNVSMFARDGADVLGIQ